MPELPEVETVKRGLAKVFDGRRIDKVLVRRPDLRFPLPSGFASFIEGRRIAIVGRRAKYLLLQLDNGGTVLGHLGMSGRLVIGPEGSRAEQRHDHLCFVTEDGVAVYFNDPRRFGFFDFIPEGGLASHPMLAPLGPEPLGDDFDGELLAARLRGRKSPLKAALLDQRLVAGLGNIYVSESLFQARLSPLRRADTLSAAQTTRLAAAIRDVLSRAIAAGGSSFSDFVQASGELGYFQHHWAVYGREGEVCPAAGCVEPILRIIQSGRSTFYCPHHQR